MSELNIYLFEYSDYFTEKQYLGIVNDGRGFFSSLRDVKYQVKSVTSNKHYCPFKIKYFIRNFGRFGNLEYLGKVTDELIEDLIFIEELKK